MPNKPTPDYADILANLNDLHTRACAKHYAGECQRQSADNIEVETHAEREDAKHKAFIENMQHRFEMLEGPGHRAAGIRFNYIAASYLDPESILRKFWNWIR